MSSLQNNNDIEANSNNPTLIDTGSISGITNTNAIAINLTFNNDDNLGSYCFKSIIIFIILVFGLPLTICDLYYAFNDNTCVSSHVDMINVNLKQYLQVSGLLMGCFIFIIILGVLFLENSNGILLFLGTILFIFVSIFNTAWNIIGGVIFWKYMDNSLCSNNVFNYVFASLIIKYICAATTLLSNNNKKN